MESLFADIENPMTKIHNKVLDILMTERKSNPELRFTLRQRNVKGRLDKGFWFHGNDYYLAVSFWSGTDWRNKTPNIFFVVLIDGTTYLEIIDGDTRSKRIFIKDVLLPAFRERKLFFNIGENEQKIKILRGYQGKDFEQSLINFLNTDKLIIDEAIRSDEAQRIFDTEDEYDKIGDINEDEFKSNLERIITRKFGEVSIEDYYGHCIKSISINNVADIRGEINIDIPHGTNWVFITGENGSGKTSVLKAIASHFYKDSEYAQRFLGDGHVSVETNVKHLEEFPVQLIAYGPSRLITSEVSDLVSESVGKKQKDDYSLFNSDGVLHSFDELLNSIDAHFHGRLLKCLKEMFEQDDEIKIEQEEITNSENETNNASQLFSENSDIRKKQLFPQIGTTTIKKWNAGDKLKYQEIDEHGCLYPEVEYEKLASGIRSQLALIGDLIYRLKNLLPQYDDDLSVYDAIVIIDEIDIHFHPSMQKKIVEILSDNFPKIQFIVTTHSPVTLLGAPERSVFYKVKRNATRGVWIDRLEHIDENIKNMLPNVMLSSDLFDFDEIISNQNTDIEDVIVVDDLKIHEQNKRIDEQLNILKINDEEFFNEIIKGNDNK